MAGRVAYLSNMNNNGFATVQYLRDRGIDAHTFRFPYEPAHFGPASDSFRQDFREFVHAVPWGDAFDVAKFAPQELAAQLAPFEVLFGAGTAPAYVARAGRVLDAFIPYGEDIISLPHRRLAQPKYLAARQRVRNLQREGIRSAKHIIMDDAAPDFLDCLQKLHPRGKWHRLVPPALYLPEYTQENLAAHSAGSRLYSAFKPIRDAHDLVLFSHSRHHWISRPNLPDWIMKANDKMIRGLALFTQRHPQIRVHLVTFEYGPDVAASKALAKELGIEHLITWFPISPRKEIMICLAQSDIGVGELHESWLSYGVMLEVLASGIPFIGRREGALAERPDLYPMASVGTAEAFAEALHSYVEERAAWKQMGQQAHTWLLRQIELVIDVLADLCQEPTRP